MKGVVVERQKNCILDLWMTPIVYFRSVCIAQFFNWDLKRKTRRGEYINKTYHCWHRHIMPPTTLFSRIMGNKYFSSTTRITLEPFIITFIFVWFLMDGAQIQKNLLMWKICKFQLNQTEIVCGNLSAYNETQSEVQTRANNFEMVYHTVKMFFLNFYLKISWNWFLFKKT